MDSKDKQSPSEVKSTIHPTTTYDHSIHAGNAGDVWKHFILAEVANYLIAREGRLTYAESHVGRLEYSLRSPGEWEEGVGRLWQNPGLLELKEFPYLQILAEMNPSSLKVYPGSARVIMKLAGKVGAALEGELWDISPDVASSWISLPRMNFHRGDGFGGIRLFLKRAEPGLLLIDPPYVDPMDSDKARDLIPIAEKAGWVTLWWYMAGQETLPGASQGQVEFSLNFSDAGMKCGRWKGAALRVSGMDGTARAEILKRTGAFLDLIKPKVVDNSEN
jgi:23S rRNA (adenine2030-N6)-methyltransferase